MTVKTGNGFFSDIRSAASPDDRRDGHCPFAAVECQRQGFSKKIAAWPEFEILQKRLDGGDFRKVHFHSFDLRIDLTIVLFTKRGG